jgi:Methane oxygenase PmoA
MKGTFCWLACVAMLGFGQPAWAQPKIIAKIEIENPNPKGLPSCIPLSVAKEFGELTDITIRGKASGGDFVRDAQLTRPGLLTEKILPSAKDLVRRDLHLSLPYAAGKYEITVSPERFGLKSAGNFKWQATEGKYAELSYDGIPVLRYVHQAYDNSTTLSRDKTYKVFHHLYDPAGKRFVTNGGDTNDPMPKNPKDSLYPHHRGLMYAFNIITFDGNKKCDTWHAKPGDTHQSHEGFLSAEAGSILGRHRVAVDWHGPSKEVFAKEEREMTVYKLKEGTLVEFASRLKTTGGLVKLAGDPQHAGFQFRAHNDVHEQKMDKQTYYVRPDGKGKMGDTRNWEPKTKQGPVNLPWDAGSFVIDGKRYTVAYLNNPKNPGESRWSERDYGRFGCYFEYDLTPEKPLVVNYRIWLQDGEMTGEQVEALSKAFLDPPKVTVK